MPILACTHSGITVTDMDRAKRFYIEGLGFRTAGSGGDDGHKIDASGEYGRLVSTLLEFDVPFEADVEFLNRDGATIELVAYVTPAPVTDTRRPTNICGLTHLGFEVDDVDATAERLVALGGSVLSKTDLSAGPDGRRRKIVLCTDPDRGARLELSQVV